MHTHGRFRSFGMLLSVALFLVPSLANAQVLNFTKKCQEQASPSEIRLMESAYLEAWSRQGSWIDPSPSLFGEIDHDLSGANQHLYVDIPADHSISWQKNIDKVKIACHFNNNDNPKNRKCNQNSRANPNGPDGLPNTRDDGVLNGWCSGWNNDRDIIGSWGNKIHICVDNVLGGSTDPDAQFGSMAGTIAHEVMHGSDGSERHTGPGGSTTPQNPTTSAGTVGVAMEHLLLTPDLSVQILEVRPWLPQSMVQILYWVEVDIQVTNTNALSGTAGTSIPPATGQDRNVTTDVCVESPSQKHCTKVSPLDGLASAFDTIYVLYEPYQVLGGFDITATVDPDDIFYEDETNNEDTMWFSTEVDLEIANVEVVDSTFHQLEWVDPPLSISGYYNWRELTYEVTLRNNGPGPSPDSDLVHMYDDMWTDSGITSNVEYAVPSLQPGESFVVQVPVDIETDIHDNVVESAEHWFIADGNAQDINDSDLGNNYHHFKTDELAPDYRIEALTSAFIYRGDGSVEVTVEVRNAGGEAAGGWFSWLELLVTPEWVPNPPAYTTVTALGPGETSQHSFDVDGMSMVGPVTVKVTADALQQITESDESNNSVYPTVVERELFNPF